MCYLGFLGSSILQMPIQLLNGVVTAEIERQTCKYLGKTLSMADITPFSFHHLVRDVIHYVRHVDFAVIRCE
jgi:hypothetical protein